jgi:hypothetical protein
MFPEILSLDVVLYHLIVELEIVRTQMARKSMLGEEEVYERENILLNLIQSF